MKKNYKGTSPLVSLLRVVCETDHRDLADARTIQNGEAALGFLSQSLNSEVWQRISTPFFDLLGANGYREVSEAYELLDGEVRELKQQISRIERAAKSAVAFNHRRKD